MADPPRLHTPEPLHHRTWATFGSLGVQRMSERSVVITGSTRGIGKGIAAELLKRGANVMISGRTQAAVDAAVADLRAHATTARIAGLACDVTSGAGLQALWDAAAGTFGTVDIWVNNAGISHPRQRAGEMRTKDVCAVQETNLLGAMLATQVALRGMQKQAGGGTIWNMEGYGSSGMMTPGMSLYGASKFALTYFNKAMIEETRNGPIKICYLSPGIVLTDLLKRDVGSNSPEDLRRTLRAYNILGDRVETVTPFLAEGLLAEHRSGDRVAWLTGAKAARRFFMSIFKKRQVMSEADFAAG